MPDDLTTTSHWDERWQQPQRGKLRQSISPMDSEYLRFLRFALKNVPQDGHLLELGGAPGTMLLRQHAARPDLTVDCLDFSPVGVEATKLEYARSGMNGSVHHADFREWTTGEGRYDVVTSFGLIEHFEDFQSVIRHHFKFCKPGGTVVITIPNYGCFPVRNLLRRYSTDILQTHNLECMSQEALRHAAKDFSTDVITGGTGSSILPYSRHDRSISGKIYSIAALAFNGMIALLTLLLFRKVELRIWPTNLFLIAKARP